MFKIESYIAPLLMGYIDKYVKLRTEDFQLSLWGGDVVLNNLDLRLDVIEQAIQLPIIFKSGHIHELRIHVPWTKLRSEPVVITINTIECILKVRDTAYDDNAKPSSSGFQRSSSQQRLRLKQKPEGPDLPPGYLQSLVHKIVNNVNIIVNNLILKFVEDDIVLSINVKSAECYSVDKEWTRAFVELSPVDLILRRVVSFCDLTVCLDKSDASGKIEMYQDPVLYRSSITCRLHMAFEAVHSKFSSVTKVNMFCDKLDLTLTDTQLPMLIRLIQLCLAIYYGDIDMSCDPRTATDEPTDQEVTRAEQTESDGSAPAQPGPSHEMDVGWGEWAWSYVPQILPEDGEESSDPRLKSQPTSPPIISIGVYIPKASITFKLTESIRESIHYGPNKVSFKPLLFLESEGLGLEILAEGLKFLNAQCGVTSLSVSSQGDCVCGEDDSKLTRSSLLLSGGSSLTDPRPLCYSSNSLFDPLGPDNTGEVPDYVTDIDSHMETYTESFGLQKYGIFWFDYVYKVDTPESRSGSSRSSASGEIEEVDSTKETAFLRFLVGGCTLNFSSSLYHRVKKIIDCAINHQYEPYHKLRPERSDEDKSPPNDQQINALEEFIPTRTYHMTFVQPIVNVLTAEHAQCDIKRRRRKSSSKKQQKGKSSPSPPKILSMLPAVRMSADRFDLQISCAMYAKKLVSMVSKMAGASSNLLHHCYSHTQVKLFSLQIGLTCIDTAGIAGSVVTILPACSGALYKRSLMNPSSWQNLHLANVEWMYEAPSVVGSLTKPQLLLLTFLGNSWVEKTPRPSLLQENSLLHDTFPISGKRPLSREPLLEVTLSGFELKHCTTPLGISATGTLTSLHAVLYAKVDGRDTIIPIFSAPSKSSLYRTVDYFTSDNSPPSQEIKVDWVTFSFQIPSTSNTPEVPAVMLAEVGGVSVCLDPTIYQWLLYTPRIRPDGRSKSQADKPKIFVDVTLANAASPLNPSQLSAHSESSVKDRSDSYQTPTNTQSPTKGQPQLTTSSPALLVSTPGKPGGKLDSGSELPGKYQIRESAENFWGRKCAEIYPLVRILQIQVNLASVCVFMPKSPVVVGDASMDIAENLRGVFHSGTLPDTLVINLPHVRLLSCAFKPMSVLQEIPIPALEGTLAGEKLPWAIQVSDISMYSLHKMRRGYSMVKPTDFSCTVAVSSKFSPPTSDNISSLGACLHVEMTNVQLAVSPIQAQTAAVLVGQITSVVSQLHTFWASLLPSGTKKPIPSKSDPLEPIPISPPPIEQSVSGAEGVTTETSEELSRETTPNRELEIEELQSGGVKLSFWLQWTLPKFELQFFGEDKAAKIERCVSVQLEELSMSIDIQEVYGKVKSKIGLAKISHSTKGLDRQSLREPGAFEGLLVSGPSTLPKNIEVVSNKLWSSESLPSPMGSLYSVSESASRDKTHGLLSFTFTRALCKNVKRRMRRLNVELAGLHETANQQVQEMLSNNYQKYVSEICLSIEPCDVIFYRPAILVVVDVFNLSIPRDPLGVSRKLGLFGSKPQIQVVPRPVPISDVKSAKLTSSKSSEIHPKTTSLSSASLPLLYINVSNLRIFVPAMEHKTNLTLGENSNRSADGNLNTSSEEKVTKVVTTLNPDLFLLQFSSLVVNPQADNPLPRYVLEKELYRRALDAGITQHPGSQLEDRQYQLDIRGLTLCSGVWGDFARHLSKKNQSSGSRNPTVQIPAVEWNNLISPCQKEADIRVIPLVSRFDFKVVMAPAIVYSPPPMTTSFNSDIYKSLVVCGHAVEVNITSDLDFYFSSAQINLMHQMIQEQLSPPVAIGHKMTAQLTDPSQLRGEIPLNDSGVESDASTVNTQILLDPINRLAPPPTVAVSPQETVTITTGATPKDITPLDILVTAGRMTCMMYIHKAQTGDTEKLSDKRKQKLSNSKSKREKKGGRYNGKKGSYREPWASCGYLADESSDEFEGGTYDPSAHLRFLSLHPQIEKQKSLEDDSGFILVPFLYSYLSQPHAVMSLQQDGQKFELSCYDMMLKGPSVDHYIKIDEHKLLPDCSDYSVHWLETRAGSPNHKTGVPPSLVTIRITDLLQGPVGVSVELERPVKLCTSLSKLIQVNQFIEETVATWTKQPAAGGGNPNMSGTLPHKKNSRLPPALTLLGERLKSFEIQTEQVILYGQTINDQQSPFLLLALSSVSAEAEIHLSQSDQLAEIICNVFAKDILLKTGFENKSRPLIGPFTVNCDSEIQWCDHSGPPCYPKVTIVTDMGLVPIEIGQEHLMCLEIIQDHIGDYLQSDCQIVDQPERTSESHDLVMAPSQKRLQAEFIVEHTKDDLKSGAFQYIVDEGENLHPNPGEIVFGVENEANDDTMTWSYYQPRVISHFSVSPVPFNVSEDGSTSSISMVTKIPCLLQYWDVMARHFVNYYEFFLSEDMPCELSLPEVKPHKSDLKTALMWRVVISGHIDSDLDSEERPSSSSLPRGSSIVLPMSLAACIRVDSCFVPSLVPTLQLSISTSVIQIHLSNHLQHLAEEVPTKLQPFFVDSSAMPYDQEFALVTIDNLGVIASRIQGQEANTSIQLSGVAQLDVVEYNFLTKQTVMESTSFHSNVSLIPDKNLMVECSLNLDPVMVRVGKGVLHTLSSTAQAWQQVLSDNMRRPTPRIIFNHYTVCNDTQNSIRFGQVGTDENVCLMSREMSLYSWRTPTLPQKLHLCLDGSKWQWCEPFSIYQPGTVVCRVNTADQTYTIIIRVKQISNIHTQVIISGQLVVSSRLSQVLELKMLMGQSESSLIETSTMMSAGTTSPSWIVEESNMRSFRIRLTSQKTLWSQEVFVSGDRMTENRLVKIPLHDGGQSIHVWCRLFHETVNEATQTLVLLSPLYVIQNHLPQPLFLNLETLRLKTKCQIEAPCQGKELQLQCVGGDICHSLSFQLGRNSPKSSPPITLYTGLIEQVARSPLPLVNIPSLCYNWKTDFSQHWPYTSEDGISMSSPSASSAHEFQKRNVSAVSEATDGSSENQQQHSNVDLHVSLLEYWPGCNTLLVTVTPFCLLVNQSGLDLVALTTSDDMNWLEVANGSTVSPHNLKDGFRLGVRDDNGLAVCSLISLSDEEWSVRRHQAGTDHILFTDTFVHISILTVRNGWKQVCLLTVKSQIEHGIRILTLKEQYSVCSLLPVTQLEVSTFAIPLGQQVILPSVEKQTSNVTVKGGKSTPTTLPLLFWRVLPEDLTNDEDLSFIQYLCLRNISEGFEAERSCPLRVVATDNGTRSTVTLPKPAESCSHVDTCPLVVTGHSKGGVSYLVIQEDNAPYCVIHNKCSFPLGFGQTLLNLSAPEYTVQEETELCLSLPSVQPNRNAHYTFPYTNNKFPEMYDLASMPRLHLTTQPAELSNRVWSCGIDLSVEQDAIFGIPGGPDLKIHMERVAMVRHVVIETVSKADISAKEIRSRIKGQEITVVVKAETSKKAPGQILQTNVVADFGTNTKASDGNLQSHSETSDQTKKPEDKINIPTKKEISEHVLKTDSSIKNYKTETYSKTKTNLSLGIFFKQICFVLLDESSSVESVSEILRVTVDDAYLAYYPVSVRTPNFQSPRSVEKYCLGVCAGDLQVDNQCFSKGQFDFPVMLVKQKKNADSARTIDSAFFELSVIEKHAYLRNDSLLQAQVVRVRSPFATNFINESLEASVQPLCVFVDDCFIHRILKEVELLIPIQLPVQTFRPISCRRLPSSILVSSVNGAKPAVFHHLSIQPIKLLLSVHASLKVFIASDQTPLTFGKFERSNVFTTSYQLTKTLAMHYVSGAIFRAGLVVGSLDVLGNPTGLMRSVGNGVADLFRLPYAGLTHSPGAFVAGISNGMSSFLRNISAGTVSSITNFATTVSRNMDRLSLDREHSQRQDENRKTRPDGLSAGIRQGLTGFGLSLLGAVAGLADQPIQGAIHNQQLNLPATSTATGIVSGVGKGLMGVVTKPIGGAAEFVSQTGQGFLYSTGLVKLAEQRYSPLEELWSTAHNSRIKHVWKMLHSLPPGNCLLMELAATQYDAGGHPVLVTLLLTTDILFVMSCEDDNQQQAFTAIELDCPERISEPTIITLVWTDSFHHAVKQDLTNDRIAEFVDKSSSFVSLAGLERSIQERPAPSSPSISPDSENTSLPPQYQFHVNPHYKDVFVTWLKFTKQQLLGQGFQF